MSWNDWLRHAFAVEPPGPASPSPAQCAVVDRLCQEIVRRGLTTPALFLLELSRPLNYLGAQALHFLTPLVAAVADVQGLREFSAFLEQRGSIDYICSQLEECVKTQEAPPSANGTDDGSEKVEEIYPNS